MTVSLYRFQLIGVPFEVIKTLLALLRLFVIRGACWLIGRVDTCRPVGREFESSSIAATKGP